MSEGKRVKGVLEFETSDLPTATPNLEYALQMEGGETKARANAIRTQVNRTAPTAP